MTRKNLLKRNKSNPTQTSARTEDLQEKIRKKAFELFEQRGYGHGNDMSDWLEAERIVKSQMR